jgi:hypothetical protein
MAGSAAFNHVAGESERRTTEADDGKFIAKVFGDETDGLRNITELGGAVGAKLGDIFGSAHGLFDDGTFAGGKMERQSHDFEGKEKIGEDDGGVDAKKLGRGDGDFGSELGLLADFEQRMLLANGAVLGHVASCLAHEPDGSVIDGLRLAGADEVGIGSRHEFDRWTDYFSIFSGRAWALGLVVAA